MADRTVSVALRANVAGFIGEMQAAARAVRQLREEAARSGRDSSRAFEQASRSAERHTEAVEDTEEATRRATEATRDSTRETDRSTQSTERARRAHDQARDSLGRFTRTSGDAADSQRELASAEDAAAAGMLSLKAGAVVAGAAIVSAGVAAAGFGAVALPTITKVISAQEDLAANWSSLSEGQQRTALSVRALSDEYEGLAASYEPQALEAFNSVLASTRVLLPQVDGLLQDTSGSVVGLVDRLAAFASGPEVSQFLTWAGDRAPAALDELGDAAITTGSLGLQLVQDLEPVGMAVLTLANGALGLANGLARVDPLLAQLAVTGLLLRGPVTALVAGFGAMTTRVRDFAAASRGATIAQRGMLLASAAGPGVWTAAGVALALLAFRIQAVQSETGRMIDQWRVETKAVGNNLSGYQQLNAMLAARREAEMRLLEAARQRNATDQETAIREGARYFAIKEMTRVIAEQDVAIRNLRAGTQQIAATYNITAAQAEQLATAAGVTLATSMDKSGQLTAQARMKIEQYAQSAQLAANPTQLIKLSWDQAANSALSLKDRVTALSNAMAAQLNPSIALFDANLRLREGFAQLRDQLDQDGASMNGTNAASRRLQQTFSDQIKTTRDLFSATFEQTKNLDEARFAVMRLLPQLYKMTQGDADAKAMVDALATSLVWVSGKTDISRKSFMAMSKEMGISKKRAAELWEQLKEIKSRTVGLDINASGHWSYGPRAIPDGPAHLRPSRATGGPIPAEWALGPGGPTSDDVPAWLSVGEHVITAREVEAAGGHGAVYRLRAAMLRGDLRGYATGGAVNLARKGSTSSVVDDVLRPVEAGYGQWLTAIAREFAKAWKDYAGSGGPALAWARSQAGKPYVWGGVGPGGYDCSGFMSAIVNVIQGRSPYSRRFTTFSFTGAETGPAGFVRGLRSPFEVGVTNAGVGHMAGTLSGVNVESRGSAGVVVGSGARGADDGLFYMRYGLRMASGGPVPRSKRDLFERAVRPGASREDIVAATALGVAGDPGALRRLPDMPVRTATYDSGGLLHPGYTLAYNGTGQPEVVVRMAGGGAVPSAPPKGGGGGGLPRRIHPIAPAPLTDAQKAIRDLLNEIHRGALDSADSIRQFMDKIREQIRRQFSGAEERRLLAWTQQIQRSMEAAAIRAQAVADRIKEATDYAASTTQNARQFAGLSNLSDRGSAAGIVTGLQGRASQLKEFTGLIMQLRARGINMSLLRQVIDMGPADGAEVARTLLAVDRATWQGINAAQREIDRAADVLGKTAADALYDQGKGAARGFLTGLKDQQAELDKLMDRLGDRLTARLRNAYDFPGTMRVTPGGRGPGRVVPVGGGRVVQQNFYVTVRDRADVDMLMNEAGFKAQAASF